MSYCNTCSIEEKLLQCCGRHPVTGEQINLVLEDKRISVSCPELSPLGECRVYFNRPQGCRDFICDAYQNMEKNISTILRDISPQV